ncbi:hypothetical protein AA23498_2564 [Acetobacter nitrogenifigens DSM 23921 = NBRC 105050]|uniref:Uncharacterized protein n=2 Tax=Acetobacter nitrogenifigens TaxID=285268 RepID=A0A511X652_9PROT|nr:hypothetical protein [Acetobacter nitrogenifigens]GBQ96171.1 hypothetical protein AA23498_2564 [Acetobacter nitrogenifigens DSM 23921 = NBRC 105050]GEN58419.1 hypothetical protein ANI02nite_03030 [Acetobacter nitrogenifigens DSM 23921 = NBRC 105050]
MLKRLFLCDSDSTMGHVKLAQYAERSINLLHDTDGSEKSAFSLFGPLPTQADTASYFEVWSPLRRPNFILLTGLEQPDSQFFKHEGNLSRYMEQFDAVECWFDPTVRGQITLVHFLVYLGSFDVVPGNVSLIHSGDAVGSISADALLRLRPKKIGLAQDHIQAARRFWSAFGQPDPRKFSQLTPNAVGALPFLYQAGRKMLTELPAHDTGLSATQAALVTQALNPDANWASVVNGAYAELGGPRFDSCYIEESLQQLAAGPTPVIRGTLPNPLRRAPVAGQAFPQAAYDAHRNSRLSLTDIGLRLAAGQADMADYVPIHRWWGNTELTNDTLWRWNAQKQCVLEPQ